MDSNVSFDGVCIQGEWLPLPPSIMPVVIVKGSAYEMGYQYGRQVGHYIEMVKDAEWVEAIKTMHSLQEIERELQAAEHYIKKYAPEEIEWMEGVADGATEDGYNVSFKDILIINTRVHPPTPFANHPSSAEMTRQEDCSIWAAWGKTTSDGSLICGDSKDEAYSYQVLTVAFPDYGNAYMTTARAGEISQHFSMNNKGLFIGASGAPGERDTARDYGIPYPCTFSHLAQFSNNAKEAKEALSSWNIYWYRGLNYTFADTHRNAFVVELTAALKSIRVPGQFGERDFIFATNNFLNEEMKPFAEGTTYCVENSLSSNKQIHSFLSEYQGNIDTKFAMMMWRYPGYQRIGNLKNHRVVIALPREGDNGEAYICTGSASWRGYPTYASGPGPFPGRSNSADRAGHDYLIAPTYSFYKIELSSNPETVVASTGDAAQDAIAMAYDELRMRQFTDPGVAALNEMYSQAASERFEGRIALNKGLLAKRDRALLYLSHAATAFTRAQVHAQQVYNALVPPPTCPEDLGLGPLLDGKTLKESPF